MKTISFGAAKELAETRASTKRTANNFLMFPPSGIRTIGHRAGHAPVRRMS
jgi:hypothetical protein